MALKERAQAWLDAYKKGEKLDVEECATILSEYLHDAADTSGGSAKVKELEDTCERLHEEKRQQQNAIASLTKENESLRYSCDMSKQRLNFAEGKIAAYEFAIRCNGVSGAEVKNA